ncbi:MAG: hypothetical protein L0Z50_08880 [Verrucomicrobiales bacterium]|nr:hypothetical protein [Verrucomicrobiales bacterium]
MTPNRMMIMLNGFAAANRRLTAVALACATLITETKAATFWNESIDGDLSNDQSAPSPFTLASGVNSVIGTVGGPDDRDWLTLTVPAGLQLSSVSPAAYSSTDDVAFTGVQSGTAFVGSPTDAESYLGYAHFGPDNVGVDILPNMGSAPGAQGFTPPLGSGSYVFLIQQLGAATSYQFDYNLTPVSASVVTVTATDATGGEPGSGQGNGRFTFSRTGPTTSSLTVNYTVGGTATSGADYAAIGMVTFAAGSATRNKTVSVLDDSDMEGDETVVLTLAAGSGYTVGNPASAMVTIKDDDGVALPVVTVSATDATGGEPGSGQGNGRFTFSRTGPTTSSLTVNYTVGGTATSGTDYAAIGIVKFAAGSATRNKAVSVLDDSDVEGDETVVLTLAAGSGYTVGNPAAATVTIKDDDSVALPVVTVTATDPTGGEPGTGQGSGKFTFSRTGPTTSSLTVNYTVGGTATSGADYTAIGTVIFAAGSATKSRPVSVLDDNDMEGDETVVLTLTTGTGYAVGSPASATVTILDDDGALLLMGAGISLATSGDRSGLNLIIEGVPFANKKAVFLSGQLGKRYLLEFSDDLVNWAPLSTNALQSKVIDLPDPTAPAANQRFYRLSPLEDRAEK